MRRVAVLQGRRCSGSRVACLDTNQTLTAFGVELGSPRTEKLRKRMIPEDYVRRNGAKSRSQVSNSGIKDLRAASVELGGSGTP